MKPVKQAVGLMIVDPHKDILVLRRHILASEGGTWGLVGGYIDGDESPLAALKREVQEETGLAIDIHEVILLKTYRVVRDEYDVDFQLYRYDMPSAIKTTLNLDWENTTYEWVAPSVLYMRPNLMKRLYTILEDYFDVGSQR